MYSCVCCVFLFSLITYLFYCKVWLLIEYSLPLSTSSLTKQNYAIMNILQILPYSSLLPTQYIHACAKIFLSIFIIIIFDSASLLVTWGKQLIILNVYFVYWQLVNISPSLFTTFVYNCLENRKSNCHIVFFLYRKRKL